MTEKKSNAGRKAADPDNPNTISVHFKGSQKLVTNLKDYCIKHNQSQGNVIRTAVEEYIKKEDD